MESNIDVVNLISTLLDSGKYKEALSIHDQHKNSDNFKDNCWDLISIILSKIQDDTIIVKPSLYGACEELLSCITEKAVPEEALLEFIEQIELAKNDAQFSLILGPLQKLLKKLSLKRGRSLEWCLNSISTYIETIPIPEHNLEHKERLLLDSDNNIRRITRIYSLLPPFYTPFITEISDENTTVKSKQIIVAFLISLLGKPLIYIDMDPDSHSKSEARQCSNTILIDICIMERNVWKLLQFLQLCNVENLSKKASKRDHDDEISPYDHREKMNMTTLSGLAYIVYSGHFNIPDNAIPQVYSIEFIVHTLLLAVVHLLSFSEYGPLAKAIALCNSILNYLPLKASHFMLTSSVHYDLCKSLTNIAIYCAYEHIRKSAINSLTNYINRFGFKGRCMLIKYLIESSNHSGMIGYAITLYKNTVDQAFKEPQLDDCFTGAQLIVMIKKICHLPFGAESDLVELADQIISSLNFLRYLTLKDVQNMTGIKEHFSSIETDYLDKLRTGLNMSKAHYEEKLKSIDEENCSAENKIDVSVTIAGNVFDKIPTRNKKDMIHSALNAFHLIEGLVARVLESIRNGHIYVLPLATVPVNRSQKLIRNYCQNKNLEAEVKQPVIITGTEHEEEQYEENVKNRILQRALEFVPKSGWSIESLSSGAEAAGYPGISHGLFSNGGGDLVHYFNVKCNENLVQEMKNWPKEDLKENNVPSKFIENAIMTRLLMIEPYKNTWPKAMAIQALPNNVPNCLATLLSLVDDICYHSGDRSVDFNWYIRRVGLAGIYKATELFYLTDKSENYKATQNFVASRIRDAQLIQTALNLNPVAAAPQTLSAAFVTAKNILGVNTLK